MSFPAKYIPFYQAGKKKKTFIRGHASVATIRVNFMFNKFLKRLQERSIYFFKKNEGGG